MKMYTTNPFTETHPHKLNRSVSIIGVGCTPFRETLNDPELAGVTEGELYGYAALKAMEDAGVSPKDVQFYFHGQASPLNGSNYLTPNMQVAEWFGMRGKASLHHSEACCTGYMAIDIAAQAIASGKYDIVLTGCVEFGDGVAIQGKPACIRRRFTFEDFQKSLDWLYNNEYTRYLYANVIQDNSAIWYQKKAGLTDDEIDTTLCQLAINARRNSALNPLAIDRVTYDEVAKEAGYDDVMDYMKSPFNPKAGAVQRVSGLEHKCDGAAAAILCATDLVEKYTKNKPIKILGVGNSTFEASNPLYEVNATCEATRQLYEQTGLSGQDMDVLYANDFIITSQLVAADITGFIPENEAWKYVLDGRTNYDGDRPINPNGGRCAFGHAHAASGLADFYDAVHQIRGTAGAHQVKKQVNRVLLRGYGGAQNICNVAIGVDD
ncbi:MAG: thiolase family protein [Erysipelotrichaceae bacterium]|nr:thiolase family protein [Erysipelotrichaceae bacterium]